MKISCLVTLWSYRLIQANDLFSIIYLHSKAHKKYSVLIQESWRQTSLLLMKKSKNIRRWMKISCLVTLWSYRLIQANGLFSIFYLHSKAHKKYSVLIQESWRQTSLLLMKKSKNIRRWMKISYLVTLWSYRLIQTNDLFSIFYHHLKPCWISYLMIQESLQWTTDFVYENPEQFQKMGTIAHYYSLSCLIGRDDEMALIWLYISS